MKVLLVPLLFILLAAFGFTMHPVDYCTRCQSACQNFNIRGYTDSKTESKSAPVKDTPVVPVPTVVSPFKQSEALVERSKKNCPPSCPTRCPFPNMDDPYCKQNCYYNCPNYAV